MSVDRSDDGNLYRLRGAIEVFRVLVGSEPVVGALREVPDHLREPLIVRIEVGNAPFRGHAHLLFEDRMQDDGGPSCILEPFHGIDVVPEWRSAGDERMRETHPEA